MTFQSSRALSPSAAPFFADGIGLRFHQVADNSCAPEVRRGDYVLIAAANEWWGEGYYLLEDYAGGFVLMNCEAPLSRRDGEIVYLSIPSRPGRDAISYEEFCSRLVGKAAMICNVKDSRLLPAA